MLATCIIGAGFISEALDSFSNLSEHHHDRKLLGEEPSASVGTSEEILFLNQFELARCNEARELLLIAFEDAVLPH